MRFVILHYHIFKNAGSTIEDILDHSFGDRFGKLETPAESGLISNEELVGFLDARPAICAFSSHQIRYPMPRAQGYLFFDICFLRDPIDRLRSFYDYFRQRPNPADPMSDLANRYSLGEFVEAMIRDHSLFVRNNQVNLLACGGDSDEPDERDLELAVRRMRAASFLGVVDCFEESAIAGTAALGRVFSELDCARPAVNVSRGLQGTLESRIADLRHACGPEIYNELLRITALDRRLVELGRAEVLRRRADADVPARPQDRGLSVAARVPARSGEGGLITSVRRFVSLAPYWRELAGSGRRTLFDADYYRKSAAPGEGGGLLGFLVKGAFEGRQPHPLFDPAFYLRKYSDVAASGVNPLCDYLRTGRTGKRQPHVLFDPGFYLERNPDVRAAGLDPLIHYLQNGAAEDRKPHPLFDPKYYRTNCRARLESDQNPLVHFLESGAEAASPHPLFDCASYLAAHPEAADRGLNPLVHYLEHRCKAAGSVSGGLIQLDIQDVRLVVSCLDAEPKAIDPDIGGAAVWQDERGQTHWAAEPQQLPFLVGVGMDQILAQAR